MAKEIIIPSDKKLLEVYMWGFKDELDGREATQHINPYLRSAYAHGRADVSSDIKESNQQILKKIKNNL